MDNKFKLQNGELRFMGLVCRPTLVGVQCWNEEGKDNDYVSIEKRHPSGLKIGVHNNSPAKIIVHETDGKPRVKFSPEKPTRSIDSYNEETQSYLMELPDAIVESSEGFMEIKTGGK